MVDGEVVEDLEDDVESGTNTFCGWCRQAEEQQTEHVNPAIVSDNETEDNGAAEDPPDNLHKVAGASEKKEKYPHNKGEKIEMTNIIL